MMRRAKPVVIHPIVAVLLFLGLGLALTACATGPQPGGREQFSRACAATGEAHLAVIEAKRRGDIDQPTFNRIDDLYDAAVETCIELPLSDAIAEAWLEKVQMYLSAAGGVTGVSYGY